MRKYNAEKKSLISTLYSHATRMRRGGKKNRIEKQTKNEIKTTEKQERGKEVEVAMEVKGRE